MEFRISTRKSAVAGSFYPYDKEELQHLMRHVLRKEKRAIDRHNINGEILGGIVPHAGMKFCAYQAVHFFEVLRRSGQQPDTVIIAHPNHYGHGPAMSVDDHDYWDTTLGRVGVDKSFSEALQLPVAARVQDQEHSAEVILPYLQFFLDPGFRIVAVNMLHQTNQMATRLAWKVMAAEKQLFRKVLFIASTDFSHYLTAHEGKRRDEYVLQEIMNKNSQGVQQAVRIHDATLCGFGPVMALMEYCRMKDQSYQPHILRQGHSGEILPMPEVVRYVGLLMEAASTGKGKKEKDVAQSFNQS